MVGVAIGCHKRLTISDVLLLFLLLEDNNFRLGEKDDSDFKAEATYIHTYI